MHNTKRMPSAFCAGAAMIAASLWITPASANLEDRGSGKAGSEKTEFQCLAEAIYFEARGEPTAGQVAVAQVILNRVESPLYPDTICNVVYQNAEMSNRCQFSFACDGKEEEMDDPDGYADAVVAAKKAMACDSTCRENKGGVATSTFYHANYVEPDWSSKFQKTGTIGRHIFYYSATL